MYFYSATKNGYAKVPRSYLHMHSACLVTDVTWTKESCPSHISSTAIQIRH